MSIRVCVGEMMPAGGLTMFSIAILGGSCGI